MDMHTSEFRTAMQLRKYLAGIEQPVCIEGAFQALLLRQIDFAEHHRHQIALFDTDAVLAGENAADFHAKRENIRAERFRAIKLAVLVGVIKNKRMKVAVAGMKNIGDA